MSSFRSYLPIACAVTRFPIAASSSRRDGREAARANLSLCPIMIFSPPASVYKYTEICHTCKLQTRLPVPTQHSFGGSAGTQYVKAPAEGRKGTHYESCRRHRGSSPAP